MSSHFFGTSCHLVEHHCRRKSIWHELGASRRSSKRQPNFGVALVVSLLILTVKGYDLSTDEDLLEIQQEQFVQESNIDFGPNLLSSSSGKYFSKDGVFRTLEENYGNPFDPVTALLFLLMQVYHAQVDDKFPTVMGPLRFTPASDGFFELRPCKRTDLAKCLYYGTLGFEENG